jgi:NAD(P)-dependent dehydrogenase (short-subunit alcohol dehydrogenase family)
LAVVIADVRAEAVHESANRLQAAGIRAEGVVADVTDSDAMTHLARRVDELFGRIDLVCLNAGVSGPAAPAWEQTPDTWQRMIEIKLLGVAYGVRAFVPSLVARRAGHVLVTASSGGLAPLPARSPYSATMHAVIGLTETLAAELKEVSSDLGATVLCPGLVDTELGTNSAALGMGNARRSRAGSANAQPSMRELAAAMGGILSPQDVALAAIDAVEADRLHVAPGGGVADKARARIAELADDLSL